MALLAVLYAGVEQAAARRCFTGTFYPVLLAFCLALTTLLVLLPMYGPTLWRHWPGSWQGTV